MNIQKIKPKQSEEGVLDFKVTGSERGEWWHLPDFESEVNEYSQSTFES